MIKTALIIGVTGQDGSLLASLLLENNYKVIGTSRNELNLENNLKLLEIEKKIIFKKINPILYEDLFNLISEFNPEEIYNLSGQTSVGKSFFEPYDTFKSIYIPTLNILECIRNINKSIRFYNACSSECFGECFDNPANESSIFKPVSPYAVAKVSSHNLVQSYRLNYNIFASTGFLFNHESPLRPNTFVIKKIIKTAYNISKGSEEKLLLGNLSVIRDWGWAPDFVKAIWKMLQINSPEDFIISTGYTISLEEFIKKIFLHLNLDYSKHIIISNNLIRTNELQITRGNPNKAKNLLNWNAKTTVDEIIIKMLKFEEDGKFEL